MEKKNTIAIKNLQKWFELRRSLFANPVYLRAVDGVSLNIDEAEAISLVGESGCGKTTLGKTLLRLYDPTDGEIIFKGRDVTHLKQNELKWYRRETALIEQDPYGALPSFFNLYRILEEPLIIHKLGDREQRRRRIYEALEEVKLTPIEEFTPKFPHMLSGGELQRVAIARALSLRPELVIADEPVSMLDASVRVEILTLLRELQEKRKISFIYITHDLATTKYFSEKLLVMYAGKIIESGRILDVISNHLHPYTQALIKAIPDPDPQNRKTFRDIPPGEPPNLIDPPSGCRYNPRCPYRMEICTREEPQLVERGEEHFASCWLSNRI